MPLAIPRPPLDWFPWDFWLKTVHHGLGAGGAIAVFQGLGWFARLFHPKAEFLGWIDWLEDRVLISLLAVISVEFFWLVLWGAFRRVQSVMKGNGDALFVLV